jgi:hypothetical protein
VLRVTAPLDLERLAEQVAERVAELLATGGGACEPEGLLDADQVATRLGVERDWVYRHQVELRARRLGDRDKGRLRFLWADVLAGLPCTRSRGSDPPEPRIQPARRRPRRQPEAPLVPIRGVSVPKPNGDGPEPARPSRAAR